MLKKSLAFFSLVLTSNSFAGIGLQGEIGSDVINNSRSYVGLAWSLKGGYKFLEDSPLNILTLIRVKHANWDLNTSNSDKEINEVNELNLIYFTWELGAKIPALRSEFILGRDVTLSTKRIIGIHEYEYRDNSRYILGYRLFLLSASPFHLGGIHELLYS